VYNLWLARNDARESRKIEDPKSIVQKSVAGVEKWMNIHCTAKPKAKVVEHWLPPPIGWSKVNIDGAFRHSENWGGAGVVIRDHNGSLLSGACHFPPHVADAEGAELMASKQGLLLARDDQRQRVILETDSVEVAAKLSREGQDRSSYGQLVCEIKALVLSFKRSLVRSVRRSANDVAHRLAKKGCDNKMCRVWHGVAPNCTQNRLVLDSGSE
jgi:ribonuclease HI